MKFIRNARFRERIVDITTKALLLAVSVLACLWMISGARAGAAEITAIRQGPAGGGEYAVDFAFSSPVAKDDVTVEFQRNFIQVSLRGVSAYPARTEKLSHPLLEKVFTYQYQPDLARARVLLKGQASEVRGASRWEVDGQTLRLFVKGAAVAKAEGRKESRDAVKTTAAATKAAPAVPEDPEDAAVVQRIVEESKRAPAVPGPAPAAGDKEAKKGGSAAVSGGTEEQPVFGSPAGASPKENGKTSPVARTLASLLFVVGVIGAAAVGYRRFVLGRGMPFQRSSRVIETIASQSLGPKRSVAVIRVLDQYMVVGMAGDGMSLLANLGANVNLDKYEDSGAGASFADAFQGAIAAPQAEAAAPAPAKPDFRSLIKKRVEGFKPL